MIAKVSEKQSLSKEDFFDVVDRGLQPILANRRKTLFIIPDATRTMPLADLIPAINRIALRNTCSIDYMIALGTHPPLSNNEIEKMVGVKSLQRLRTEHNIQVFNHEWMNQNNLYCPGTIPADEVHHLTAGLLDTEIPVVINKRILEYEQLVICGPVFPHEVAGFSGGEKYLFPGIAGPEIIHITHWLGALSTSMDTIGRMETPVRHILRRAASYLKIPIFNMAFCLQGEDVFGIFIGEMQETWYAAAEMSAEVNVIKVPRQYKSVLSVPEGIYNELWTAAKAMYKLESIVADGGELIIYAPNLTEISLTHGEAILSVGYHVRDYFTKQWETYQHYPWAVLAHSTHLKGKGSFENGIEKSRIQVSLASGIPRETCIKINLGYVDPESILFSEWKNHSERMLIEDAGEVLYQFEPKKNFIKKTCK